MDKDYILLEIKRTAEANGGVPLGMGKFLKETKIKQSDWYGKYWIKWGDAIAEAGLRPNEYNKAFDENFIIESFVAFVQEIGHIPVSGELRLKSNTDKKFPSRQVFYEKHGKQNFILKVYNDCKEKEGYDDIISLCLPIVEKEKLSKEENIALEKNANTLSGYVYCVKDTDKRYYKIGRCESIHSRMVTLSTSSSKDMEIIHLIRTDDQIGVEKYWHDRFKEKCIGKEWFNLNKADIQAFKKWKNII